MDVNLLCWSPHKLQLPARNSGGDISIDYELYWSPNINVFMLLTFQSSWMELVNGRRAQREC